MRRIQSSHQQAELLAGLQDITGFAEHSRDWHDWFHDDKDLPSYEVEECGDWDRNHPEGCEPPTGRHEKKTAGGLFDHFHEWPDEKLHNYHRYLTTTQYGDSSDTSTIEAIQHELGRRSSGV